MKAEIHFFHSGNGDTILVRGGEEWGLVDANLLKSRRVRARVESVLELAGVKRLRFVCITHFDLDHIRGLVTFLTERFSEVTSTGRIWKIDQIICPVFPTTLGDIATLKAYVGAMKAKSLFPELREKAEEMSKECNLLLDLLCEIATSQTPKRLAAGATKIETLPAGRPLFGPPSRPNETTMGPWSIVCLGPKDETSQRYSARVMNEYLNSEALRQFFADENTNPTSRILTLRHNESGEIVLLTGDSTPEELKPALLLLENLNRHQGKSLRKFRCIKVSHHGAKTCHVEEIYDNHCDWEDTIAIICAEDDGKHPHPDVTVHISNCVQDCRITGRRGGQVVKPARRRHGVPLGHKRTDETPEDIRVRFPRSNDTVSGGHPVGRDRRAK